MIIGFTRNSAFTRCRKIPVCPTGMLSPSTAPAMRVGAPFVADTDISRSSVNSASPRSRKIDPDHSSSSAL
jgi:hypothetical protein